MPTDGDGDWLSRGIGGAIWPYVEDFLRQRMDTSDARRARRLEAGHDVDERGLPIGSIPAEFIDRREEARLVYPGAREVFRTVGRGSGSMLARIMSLDAVPAATLSAGYVAAASAVAVLDWFQEQLEARAWQSRPRQGAKKLAGQQGWDALQGFDRAARESFFVTVPTTQRARSVLEYHGVGWPPPGHTYFEVNYRISVEHLWDRHPPF